jgi:hypothetical protein
MRNSLQFHANPRNQAFRIPVFHTKYGKALLKTLQNFAAEIDLNQIPHISKQFLNTPLIT